jgi:hypothetical protein
MAFFNLGVQELIILGFFGLVVMGVVVIVLIIAGGSNKRDDGDE